MRLVNFGIGEITDRLAILCLKILHGTAAGADTKHFVDEKNTLLAQIRSRTLNEKWFESALELVVVNAALWQAEDELRELRPKPQPLPPWDPVAAARDAAFRTQELNDQRAQLIDAINKETGEYLGLEKLR